MMDVGPLDNNIDLDTGKSLKPPSPPSVDDDPGWTSSTKEYRRTSRKNRRPSNTPYTKSWPRPKKKPTVEQIMAKRDFESDPMLQLAELIIQSFIRFLHWINRIMRTNNPKPKGKSKHTDQEMATLGELFEGYEEQRQPSKTPYTR